MESRMYVRCLGLIISVAALSGCGTIAQHPIDPTAGNALKDKTVSSATHAAPDFAGFTPTKAAFGIFGAAAMVEAGKAFVRENGIEDPAPRIASGVVAALRDKYHMTTVPQKAEANKDGAPTTTADGVDYVVDVQTQGWNYAYLPTGWTRYRLNYVARMRLIDVHSAQVIAEAGCSRSPSDEKDTVSFDTLEANHGQWVKDTLNAYAEGCVEEFKKIVGFDQAAG